MLSVSNIAWAPDEEEAAAALLTRHGVNDGDKKRPGLVGYQPRASPHLVITRTTDDVRGRRGERFVVDPVFPARTRRRRAIGVGRRGRRLS